MEAQQNDNQYQNVKQLSNANVIATSVEALECKVCYDLFDKIPGLLKCGHSFCYNCINLIRIKASCNETHSFQCPLCTKPMSLTDVAIPNYAFDDVIRYATLATRNNLMPEKKSWMQILFNKMDNFFNLSPKHASWKIGFTQPISEYLEFCKTLEKNKVALESVRLSNDRCKMYGTIKVANMSFAKYVFVRWTSNGWKSYHDRQGIYQSSSSKTFDTFAFEIYIPKNVGSVTRIEFCICYVACGVGYWDSNNRENYSLICETQPKAISQMKKDIQERETVIFALNFCILVLILMCFIIVASAGLENNNKIL